MTTRIVPIAAAFFCAATLAGCGGDDEATVTTTDTRASTTTTDEATPARNEAGEAVLEVEVREQNGSGQSGTATLIRMPESKTEVVVDLANPGDPEQPQAAEVRAGTCADPGTAIYPLNTVESGRSSTRVAAAIAELRGGYVIAVHESTDPSSRLTACADLAARAGGEDDSTDTTAEDEDAPDLGEGPVTGADVEAYEFARKLCSEVPRAALERTFGVRDSDLRELARAVASQIRPSMRTEATDGCLDALEQREGRE